MKRLFVAIKIIPRQEMLNTLLKSIDLFKRHVLKQIGFKLQIAAFEKIRSENKFMQR